MRKEIIVSVAALALFLSPLPSMANVGHNIKADKKDSKPGGPKGGHHGGEYRHGTIYVKNINQTAINIDKVENKGDTRVTKISGPNASASTSATGAS